ncbi:MAG: transposase domain-containing protein, partial [Planctomycetes bacterium]|nr:transposase domain-containing protein [Planctomycetota bacterium]
SVRPDRRLPAANVEPFAYLKDVLTRIAAHPVKDLAALLPNRWKPAAV